MEVRAVQDLRYKATHMPRMVWGILIHNFVGVICDDVMALPKSTSSVESVVQDNKADTNR